MDEDEFLGTRQTRTAKSITTSLKMGAFDRSDDSEDES